MDRHLTTLATTTQDKAHDILLYALATLLLVVVMIVGEAILSRIRRK